MVSVPERSKGVDSSSTVFALVGSNPTADTSRSFGIVLRNAELRPFAPSQAQNRLIHSIFVCIRGEGMRQPK